MPAFRMLTFYITMSTIIVHVDFLLIFMGFPRFCPHYLCYVDKLSSVDKFIIFSIFNNSLFYKGLRGYLPQQFLYFLPLPHVVGTPIFIILIIFIILLIFQGFSVLVIYYIYNIYSIFVIINISLLQTNRKQCCIHLLRSLYYLYHIFTNVRFVFLHIYYTINIHFYQWIYPIIYI